MNGSGVYLNFIPLLLSSLNHHLMITSSTGVSLCNEIHTKVSQSVRLSAPFFLCVCLVFLCFPPTVSCWGYPALLFSPWFSSSPARDCEEEEEEEEKTGKFVFAPQRTAVRLSKRVKTKKYGEGEGDMGMGNKDTDEVHLLRGENVKLEMRTLHY